MMKVQKSFASDNNSGIHPKVLEAIVNANEGHALAYGDDQLTQKATSKIREVFGRNCDCYFVFNGTAANVLALATVTRSFEAIICAKSAHVNTDECGAPEKFTGCKLISVETEDGKLRVEDIKPYVVDPLKADDSHNQHHNQPRVIVISQTTEMGTIYSVEEIRAITDFAHDYNMLVLMDGSRISNAAASLGKSLPEITCDAGIDILSFGGTKNGLLCGEAVVFFDRNLSKSFKFVRKQGMQLASKMRFIAAQFLAYLSDDLWKQNAAHANEMAIYLAEKVRTEVPDIVITKQVDANAVFALLPRELIKELQSKYFFYIWNEATGEVRWMTSFDTTKEDIDEFVTQLKSVFAE
jgi:threonine aldolase